jgi:subtilisin family serine protease
MRLCSLLCSVFVMAILGAGVRAQAPEPDPVVVDGRKASPKGLLVKQKDPADAARSAKAGAAFGKAGLRTKQGFGSVGVKGLALLEKAAAAVGAGTALMTGPEIEKAIQELQKSGDFEYVEPDWIVTVSQTPADTAFADGRLWGLRNTGQDGGVRGVDVNAVPAWALTTGSPTVIVGVVDSGIRYSHQDLARNMWVNPGEIAGNGLDDDANGYVDDLHGINGITNSGNPMDDNNHGSHCAGTIAAGANNAGLQVGVAYNVKLMGLKFLNAAGSGATSDAIKCINYGVAKGARILNASWGGGGFSQALLDSINAANAAGVLVVAAAGNTSSDTDAGAHYPAGYDAPNVLSVAAVDRTGALASFSNYGSATVDLAAPGVAVLSCTATSDSSYAAYNGTSMAAPYVTGVAALLFSRFPGAGLTEIRNRLMATTRPLPSVAGRSVSGGMADAHAALTVAADGVLELRASAAAIPLRSGAATAFHVTVTDLTPVAGAMVSAGLGLNAPVAFLDNGLGPDGTAHDGVYSAFLTVPASGSSVLLKVQATAGGATAAESFPFEIGSPPSNDNFANRILLATGTTQTAGNNRLATREAGEPLNPFGSGENSVWWEWPSGITGQVTITTSGSTFNTTLAVYSGAGTLASLVVRDSNDDTRGLTSSVTFSAAAGSRYYLQVAGNGGSQGTITLNYPAPESLNSPPVITTQPAGAILVQGDPLNLTVTAAGTAPLSYQWSKDGAALPGATSAGYSLASVTSPDQGNYTLRITNAFGHITSAPAFVGVDSIAVRPENDAFAEASPLPGASGRVTGTNNRASGQPGEPNHAGRSTPIESVWYRWTAPAHGTLAAETYGTSFDTTLAMYTGTAVNTLTQIAANDDSGGVQSFLTAGVTAGTIYYLAVDGAGGVDGPFALNYHFQPATAGLANDDFANRTIIPGAGGTVTGRNISATGVGGEPAHTPFSAPAASVWWTWTAPATGRAVIDTLGSNFDTSLAVYTGNSVSALTPVAANEDAGGGPQSRVGFPCSAGTAYAIAVDGAGAAEGNITLHLTYGATEPEITLEQPAGTALEDGGSTVAFGAVRLTSSAALSFTLWNTGGSTLHGLKAIVDGLHAAEYTLASPLPAAIAPGSRVDFALIFTPAGLGGRDGTLRIASNDADEHPFDIRLTGSGRPPAPEIAVEQPAGTALTDGAANIPFGYRQTGGVLTRVFTVRNTGLVELTGLAASFAGTDAAEFSVLGTPPGSLAPGASTALSVAFTPAGLGVRTATLALAGTNQEENPFVIALTGIGLAVAPETRVYQAAYKGFYSASGTHSRANYLTGYWARDPAGEYRSVFMFLRPVLPPGQRFIGATLRLFNGPDGYSSADETETLELRSVTMSPVVLSAGTGGVLAFIDLGDGPLLAEPKTVSAADNETTVSVPLNSDFINEMTALPAGKYISLGGSLRGLAGSRAEFVFGQTGSLGSVNLALDTATVPTGSRVGMQQLPGLPLSDGGTAASFGYLEPGRSTDQVFTIRNTGSTDLTEISARFEGPHAADFQIAAALGTTTLPPGAIARLTVRFTPASPGLRTAALQIFSNDPASPFDVSLKGYGQVARSLDFKILTLEAVGSAVVDHESLTGDDRGGIAVGTDRVFVTGDKRTASYALPDLTDGVAHNRRMEALCSDLNSGTLYTLARNGVEVAGEGMVNQLMELDPVTGSLASIVPLAMPVTMAFGSGIFSGSGRILLHNGSRVYDVRVPSGDVIDMGAMALPAWRASDNWAIWGVAEEFGGQLWVAYRSDAGSAIVRSPVPAGPEQTIATFSDLSDMASWTVAPVHNRWYFHHESSSQFGGGLNSPSETLGYATATFAIGPPSAAPVITSPLAAASKVGESFSYTIRPRSATSTYHATGLPPGLTVNRTTGLISGNPTVGGTFPVTISATNLLGTRTATLILFIAVPDLTDFFDNFDPGIAAMRWDSFGGTATANTIGQAAGPDSTGNSLHFDGYGPRHATTIAMDARGITALSFQLALGNGPRPGWEGVEWGKEVIVLYSTNGVNFTLLGGAYRPVGWQTFIVPLPAAARTPGTRFRWQQLSDDGPGLDNWALDNVRIDSTVQVMPEIAVRAPNVWDVADDSTLYFPNTAKGNATTMIFSVFNSGSGPLTGLGLSIDGVNAADFSITESPTASVEPGAATEFTVRFAPAAVGVRTAVLHIASNDADENPFDIHLASNGIVPAGKISLFADGIYVNTSEEVFQTQISLENLGFNVIPFTDITAAGWNAAFGKNVVVLPKIDVPLDLNEAAMAAINSHLAAGRGLIIMGTDTDAACAFLNALRGWSIAGEPESCAEVLTKLRVSGFGPAPAAFRSRSDCYPITTSSLPAGALPVYQSGGSTMVFRAGQIVYLGSGWHDGSDLQWTTVLGSAIRALAMPSTEAPVIASSLTSSALVNRAFNYPIRPLDSAASYSASGLPAGFAVDPTSGLISGTPTAPGTFPITISATNRFGTGTATLTLSVLPTPTTFFDGFDPTVKPLIWDSFGGTARANYFGWSAGPGSNGLSLHFDGNGTRHATTVELDTRGISTLSFKLAVAHEFFPGWEHVGPGQEIVLLCAADGSTFTRIGGPYRPYEWQSFVVPLPTAARTNATKFRWQQLSHSGTGFDNWAIDDISLPGTPDALYEDWAPRSLPDRTPLASPQEDGIPNLLKYASNLNPLAPDLRILTPSGTAGLPLISVAPGGTEFRFEYLCRTGRGLTYTPQTSSTLLPDSWTPVTSPPTITTIDADWERVVIRHPLPAGSPSHYGRVKVTLP